MVGLFKLIYGQDLDRKGCAQWEAGLRNIKLMRRPPLRASRSTPGETPPMDAETPATLARRFFVEQNRLRGGPADELCAPGYAAHLPGGPSRDLTGHRTFAAALYAGFPDLRHEVELVAADGDRVAVRFRLHGTHTGGFLGIAPTGRMVAVAATAIMRIVHGQVAELWAEFDRLGLLAQLNEASAAVGAAECAGIRDQCREA
jgi:predicted ester cyclase